MLPLASALDFGDGSAQFGRERAESVPAAVAVAGLARLLQAVGGGAQSSGADRLRGTLETMRGGRRPVRSAARQAPLIACSDSMALSRNFFSNSSMPARSSPSHAASTLRSFSPLVAIY
jgi:hypothetical protein